MYLKRMLEQCALKPRTKKSFEMNHIMVHELNFKSSVMHVGEKSCTFESHTLLVLHIQILWN